VVLALKVLERAKRDADRGDLAALAWLITAGADLADKIVDGGRYEILRFARQQLDRLEAGEVRAAWKLD
jgi:hypothetical protein